MRNTLERSYAPMVAQVTQAIAGMEQHASTITFTLVTAEAMTTNLNQLTAGETKTQQAKAELRVRQRAVKAANLAAREFLLSAKDVLKRHLGRKYSSAWDEAGFLHSLKVPENEEKVVSLLQSLNAYLTKHAAFQNEPMNVTAARALTLRNNLITARTALNSQMTAWQLAMKERNGKMTQARGHLRALLKELAVRLSPLDERWASFGFNKPGQPQTPEVPKNVEAVLVGTNAVAVKWEPAARAKQYRVWWRIAGTDSDWVPAGSPKDLDYTFEQLPGNSRVEVAVSASNKGGESRLCEPIAVQTL
ncbi:MAG: fibronectin type III domain-containing protein [Limisphaerales bacterium]